MQSMPLANLQIRGSWISLNETNFPGFRPRRLGSTDGRSRRLVGPSEILLLRESSAHSESEARHVRDQILSPPALLNLSSVGVPFPGMSSRSFLLGVTSCRRCGRWHLLLGAGGSGTVWERPALLSGARYFVVPKELPGLVYRTPFFPGDMLPLPVWGQLWGTSASWGFTQASPGRLRGSFVACV